MSLALRNITPPPSSRMPVSNETRVRVDDLEKISAHVWPASGRAWDWPRSFLNTTASRKIFSKSARGSFSNDNKCFIVLISNNLTEFLGQFAKQPVSGLNQFLCPG